MYLVKSYKTPISQFTYRDVGFVATSKWIVMDKWIATTNSTSH